MIVSYNQDLLPKKGSEGATCYDVFVAEEVLIPPGTIKLIPTGIKGNVAYKVYARSSLAIKRKLMLANSVGVIDKDYTGELMIALYNFGGLIEILSKGERVAQIELPSSETNFVVDETLYNNWSSVHSTERGEGGFGSTGL